MSSWPGLYIDNVYQNRRILFKPIESPTVSGLDKIPKLSQFISQIKHYRDVCIIDLNTLRKENIPYSERAGIILINITPEGTYVGVGLDHKYNYMTDLAGGSKQGENIIETSLREIQEETYGVFGGNESAIVKLSSEILKRSWVVHSSEISIIFIIIESEDDKFREDISQTIHQKYMEIIQDEDSKIEPEIKTLKWMSLSEFDQAIAG